MPESVASCQRSDDTDPDSSEPYSFAGRLVMVFDTVRHPTETNATGAHRKWKQTELAAAVGVTKAYISKLCSGGEINPGLDLIRKIAKFFNVSAAVLVDDDPVAMQYIAAQLNLYSALLNKDLDVAEIDAMLHTSVAEQPAVLARVLEARRALDVSRNQGSSFPGAEIEATTGVATATVLFRAPVENDWGRPK